jgi:hypothetical protein
MSATVLMFPDMETNQVTKCCGCGKPGNDDTLSECVRCGEHNCVECDGCCSCYELAAYFAGLLPSLSGDDSTSTEPSMPQPVPEPSSVREAH